MILTCPSCATRYFTDPSTLGPKGRSVRCASCGHTWRAEPEAAEPPKPVAEPPPDPLGELTESLPAGGVKPAAKPHVAFREKVARRRRALKWAGSAGAWAGVAASLLTLAAVGYAFRTEVVRALPRSASVYAAFGVDVSRTGLEIDAVEAARAFEGGEEVLKVSATLNNATGKSRVVPYVRVSLRDDAEDEVFGWIVELETAELPAGGSVRFTTKVARPPLEAADLKLKFVEAPTEAVFPAIKEERFDAAADGGHEVAEHHG